MNKPTSVNGLSKWLNNIYLKHIKISSLRKKFSGNQPYPYLELNGFLKDLQARKLLAALTKEKFYMKESDLFQFSQTEDIAASKEEALRAFRDFLRSKRFLSFMESLTGFKLKEDTVDLSGTLYKNTDFLLCHDDQLEGRKIAFLLYLSNLEIEDGGSLRLFDKIFKSFKRITPRFNKFVLFEVSKISYHKI